MKAKMSKNKKRLAGLAALLVVAIIGASLAYWSTTLTATNEFNTKDYGGELIEHFTPDPEWEPGGTVTKEVSVSNTGDYDLIVRVKMEELWTLANGDTYTPTDIYTTGQANATDGLVTGDNSVVSKLLDTTNWVLIDGWYYYTINLQPNTTTNDLLKSVTLLADTDMGVYNTIKYLSVEENPTDADWIAYTGSTPKEYNGEFVLHSKEVSVLDDILTGYANANYTLTITSQLVQADKAAAMEAWNLTETEFDTIAASMSWSVN